MCKKRYGSALIRFTSSDAGRLEALRWKTGFRLKPKFCLAVTGKERHNWDIMYDVTYMDKS
jgi:hypothetical protein